KRPILASITEQPGDPALPPVITLDQCRGAEFGLGSGPGSRRPAWQAWIRREFPEHAWYSVAWEPISGCGVSFPHGPGIATSQHLTPGAALAARRAGYAVADCVARLRGDGVGVVIVGLGAPGGEALLSCLRALAQSQRLEAASTLGRVSDSASCGVGGKGCARVLTAKMEPPGVVVEEDVKGVGVGTAGKPKVQTFAGDPITATVPADLYTKATGGANARIELACVLGCPGFPLSSFDHGPGRREGRGLHDGESAQKAPIESCSNTQAGEGSVCKRLVSFVAPIEAAEPKDMQSRRCDEEWVAWLRTSFGYIDEVLCDEIEAHEDWP
ncbi:hypothetical protein HK405_001756, partial [Cladochytrium tenue]